MIREITGDDQRDAAASQEVGRERLMHLPHRVIAYDGPGRPRCETTLKTDSRTLIHACAPTSLQAGQLRQRDREDKEMRRRVQDLEDQVSDKQVRARVRIPAATGTTRPACAKCEDLDCDLNAHVMIEIGLRSPHL